MSEGDDNKGNQDPAGGIAAGNGGVSSAAYVLSPVPNEQKSVVQTTVDTVKSYLPSLGSLSLGGGKTEDQEARNEEEEETAAASGGAAAAATTAAAAVGLKSDDAAPTDSAGTTATSTSTDVAMADSNAKDDGVKTDTANEVSKAKDESRSADVAPTDKAKEVSHATDGATSSDTGPTDRANEESAAKTDTEAPKPDEGNEGAELKKTATGKENREAIPTAGGERLGDKHWGESKIVPDVPKKETEAPGVSSEEGQPDKATKDNTAQNTGGAPAPPSGGSPSAEGDKEKQSLKDKVKAKLNIGNNKKE